MSKKLIFFGISFLILFSSISSSIGVGKSANELVDQQRVDNELKVSISTIVQSQPSIKRGVNIVPRDFWSSSGITAQDFLEIKSWGFDHIRLHLHWSSFVMRRDGSINDAGLRQVDKYLDWADSAGLKVVLGFSQPNDGGDSWCTWYDFFHDKYTRQRFYDAWDVVLERWGERDEIEAWTPMHVPNHASTNWATRSKIWNQEITPEIIRRIRVKSSKWICWEPVPFKADNFIKLEDSKIIYTCNFYNPAIVTHRMREYSITKDLIQNDVEIRSLIEFKEKWRVPVYVGEFGVKVGRGDASPSVNRLDWVRQTVTIFEEEGVMWCYWVFGYDRWSFDLLNSDGTERVTVNLLRFLIYDSSRPDKSLGSISRTHCLVRVR